MVTRAGKELLKNTINTVNLHNRILEENEMWRQWELERGLTMMVSDDVIKQKMSDETHNFSRRSETNLNKHKSKYKNNIIKSSKTKPTTDRWDHSGFEELYPDKHSMPSSSSIQKSKAHKRKSSKRRKERSKRKHLESSSSSSESDCSESNEIWEELKAFKQKLKKRCLTQIPETASTTTSSVKCLKQCSRVSEPTKEKYLSSLWKGIHHKHRRKKEKKERNIS